MRSIIKKYSSLLLLSIFLFAYTEKSVHDMLHADDAHCHSLTEKHYHNQEHHCVICDFDISTFGADSLPAQLSFANLSFTDAVFIPIQTALSFGISNSFYNKGPPYIA